MKLAIMQPYIFPYIGYFQLINSVDKFIMYDIVQFVKKTWMTRNSILDSSGNSRYFTIPVKHQSLGILISQTVIDDQKLWQDVVLKQLFAVYRRAPFFDPVYNLVQEVLCVKTDMLSELNIYCIKKTTEYLGINTIIERQTADYYSLERALNNQEDWNSVDFSEFPEYPEKKIKRILNICIRENADTYINPIGGLKLYPRAYFEKNNIDISFINSETIPYKQFNKDFTGNLSIIDVMMFNSPDQISEMLQQYKRI